MIARPTSSPAFDLKVLDRVAKALAETKDLKDLKALRDKAEAARNYAKSAALSLQIQNYAAELKLRAERRAGELLVELVTHGGNRRSSYHDGNLKLSDLGINSNQSSRWRREAAVPEPAFEQYVAAANQLGQEITAQGLLRLERTISRQRNKNRPLGRSSSGTRGFAESQNCPALVVRAVQCPARDSETESHEELLDEMQNHRRLLEGILRPFCEDAVAMLRSSEKRIVLRLLAEAERLMERLARQIASRC